jgi:hypothetical protein
MFIVAVPVFTAVTKPLEFTVATLVLLESQLICAFDGVTDLLRVRVAPFSMVLLGGLLPMLA